MERRCSCGARIERPTDTLGCIECGWTCCPTCAVPLESVAYCASCAGWLLGLSRAPADNRRRAYEAATVF